MAAAPDTQRSVLGGSEDVVLGTGYPYDLVVMCLKIGIDQRRRYLQQTNHTPLIPKNQQGRSESSNKANQGLINNTLSLNTPIIIPHLQLHTPPTDHHITLYHTHKLHIVNPHLEILHMLPSINLPDIDQLGLAHGHQIAGRPGHKPNPRMLVKVLLEPDVLPVHFHDMAARVDEQVVLLLDEDVLDGVLHLYGLQLVEFEFVGEAG